MHTVTDIMRDINHGCMANNMVETGFSYRIIYFVNNGNKSAKHYMDTPYSGLRKTLENIIRSNLSLTNSVVVAQITVRKNKESVSLLSRSYGFCLNDYFDRVTERREAGNKKRNTMCGNTYGKKVCNWC